jgi:hypothetical protein
MFPYTMVEAILLERQQIVRSVERNGWARLADPRPSFGARVVRRMIAAAQDAAAWRRRRAGGRQPAAPEGERQTSSAT